MPLPTYQAIGTAVEGIGDVSPAWPAHAVGDVALLVIESAGGEAANLSVPAGFASVLNSPQSALTGTAGTRITAYWHRATTTSMGAPTITDPGNHVAAVIVTFRGVHAFPGDPWDVTAGGFKDVSSTSDTLPGGTTTVIDCLIVLLATRNGGTVGGVWNGTYTNAGLGSITERHNGSYPSGNGGGILVVTGTKAVAGATGTTAATLLNTQTSAYLTIALRPPRIGGAITGSAAAATTLTGLKTGVGAITGSADADTIPTGLKAGRGAITGLADADTILTGRKSASGAVTGSALARTTVVGRKIAVVQEPGEQPVPPGVVWRTGKMGGGDDYLVMLDYVVRWSFACLWEPMPIGGTFAYPAAVPGPDGTTVATSTYLYPGAEVACILEGEERRNCRFTLHDPVDEILRDEDGNITSHVIHWTLLNLFHRFKSGTLRPADDAIILRPKVWESVSPGVIATLMTHDPKMRGALEEIQTDFDDDVDSADVAYEKVIDLTLDRGVQTIDTLRFLWEVHSVDMWMERRKLRIFNPDSMSVNYAGAGKKIVIAGRDLLDGPREIVSQDRVTSMMTKGDENRFAVFEMDPAEFDAADTHTGYLEGTENYAGVKDPAELLRLAELNVELRKRPRRQITFGIQVGWGKDPLIAYQLGDWVLKHDGTEADGMPEKVRPIACTYAGDRDGITRCTITLDTWFSILQERTQRKIDGIVGGLAGFAKPSRSSVAPSAPIVDPDDILAELYPPEYGGLERVKITVPFGWNGLDVDGPPCGDFDTFLGRYAYDGGHWTVLEIGESPAVFRDLDPGRNIRLQMGSRDEADNKSWTEDLEPPPP